MLSVFRLDWRGLRQGWFSSSLILEVFVSRTSLPPVDVRAVMGSAFLRFPSLPAISMATRVGVDGLLHRSYDPPCFTELVASGSPAPEYDAQFLVSSPQSCETCLPAFNVFNCRFGTIARTLENVMSLLDTDISTLGLDELLDVHVRTSRVMDQMRSFHPELGQWAAGALSSMKFERIQERLQPFLPDWEHQTLRRLCEMPPEFLACSAHDELEEAFNGLRDIYASALMKKPGYLVVAGLSEATFVNIPDVNVRRVSHALASFYRVSPRLYVFPAYMMPWVTSLKKIQRKMYAFIPKPLTTAQVETLVALYEPQGSVNVYGDLTEAVAAAIALES